MKRQLFLALTTVAVLAVNPGVCGPACGNSITAWGHNGYGQCNVPEGNDFVAVEAGRYHSLALRSDRSLAAWGHNDYGQCDVPEGDDFVAIAAGWYHSLALRSDGSLASNLRR